MSIQAKRELLGSVWARYRVADRVHKQQILEEFVAATGYHRKYAIALLKHPPPLSRRPAKRTRKRKYTVQVQQALTTLWRASDRLCAKRLVPFLPELIAALQRHAELALDPSTKALLCSISPATADRLLRKVKEQPLPRGLSTTKPGTLLRHQIPVRTFADWDEARPGFMEADLVAHGGESAHGEYLHTLTLTDVCTGWTEPLALLNRSQKGVSFAIDTARKLLPFALVGLDSDNGSEFINHDLLRYCQAHQITFTRSRPYKKNDQCHVEQKNWSVVRRQIGYARYEGEKAQRLLEAVYQPLRLYLNFFQPSLKLVSKQRQGARLSKHYDKAKTPYQRLREAKILTPEQEAVLQSQYESLNPVELLRRIRRAQYALWNLPEVRITNEATNDP